MNCKLCESEMYPIYAYPRDIPEVIPFKAFYNYEWRDVELYICPSDVELYICPKCGSVFGKVIEDD